MACLKRSSDHISELESKAKSLNTAACQELCRKIDLIMEQSGITSVPDAKANDEISRYTIPNGEVVRADSSFAKVISQISNPFQRYLSIFHFYYIGIFSSLIMRSYCICYTKVMATWRNHGIG